MLFGELIAFVTGLAAGVRKKLVHRGSIVARQAAFPPALNGAGRYAVDLRILRLGKLVRLAVKLSCILNWSLTCHGSGSDSQNTTSRQFEISQRAYENYDSQANGG